MASTINCGCHSISQCLECLGYITLATMKNKVNWYMYLVFVLLCSQLASRFVNPVGQRKYIYFNWHIEIYLLNELIYLVKNKMEMNYWTAYVI